MCQNYSTHFSPARFDTPNWVRPILYQQRKTDGFDYIKGGPPMTNIKEDATKFLIMCCWCTTHFCYSQTTLPARRTFYLLESHTNTPAKETKLTI